MRHQHRRRHRYQVRYRDEVRYRDKDWMYLGGKEVISRLVAVGYQWEVDNDIEGRVDP